MLTEDINQKIKELERSVKKLRQTGTEFAQAEHDYKVVLSVKTLELRGSDMAVGLIDKVVYGLTEVAKARLDRDLKEVIYEANKEAINSLKVQIRVLNEQWTEEYRMTKYD